MRHSQFGQMFSSILISFHESFSDVCHFADPSIVTVTEY